MKHKQQKVLISERALIARINRKLRHDEEDHLVLKKTRGDRALLDLGYFYLLNWHGNYINAHHVNIEALGRELGVLAEWEEWDDSK